MNRATHFAPVRSGGSSGGEAWQRGVSTLVAVLLVASLAITNLPPAAAEPQAPDVAQLAGPLAEQRIKWERCDFGDDGLNERFATDKVKCATVQVPRDWRQPGNGKTWDIRISQAQNVAVGSPNYRGTIFGNPGGPGGSGLIWGAVLDSWTPKLQPYYNYVGFDPRGVGASSYVFCDFEYDENSSDRYAALKAAGKSCSNDVDVQTITTEQTAYDMDFIRYLLGAPKLSYLGFSYGTWLGSWYQKVFGAKYGDKFLLDSTIDGNQPTLQQTWGLQPVARDRQFEMHLTNWVARKDEWYGLGKDRRTVKQAYFEAAAKFDSLTLIMVWVELGGASAFQLNSLYPAAGDAIQTIIQAAKELEQQEAAGADKEQLTQKLRSPNPAANAIQALELAAAAASGKRLASIRQAQVKLQALAETKTLRQQAEGGEDDETGPRMVSGRMDNIFDMIRCNDGQWTQGANYWEKFNADLAKNAPLSNSWGLVEVPVCAFWPTQNLMPATPPQLPKTIVVQGELDSQTAWEGGIAAGKTYPNTSLITVDNEGSHGLFPYGSEEVDRPIINFFLSGDLPAQKLSVAPAFPLVKDAKVYESWRKVGPNTDHIGPVSTNPWTRAGGQATPFKKDEAAPPAASAAGKKLMADAASDQLLRQQVAKVWGRAGLKALGLAR